MSQDPTLKKIIKIIQDSRFNTLARIGAIVIVFVLALGSYHLYKVTWPKSYVSTQDNFKIVFPSGVPKINSLASQKVSGVEETGRIYSLANNTKGTDYAVYVTNYSGTNFDSFSTSATTLTLQKEIESLAQTDGGKLSGGKTINFEGLTAVQATLTPSDSSEATTNVLAFLRKDDQYILLGAGISQSKFDSFTGTFRFLN